MDTSEHDELLGLLVHVFETQDRIDGLVYLDIQKIFYHLRERLEDDDNETKRLLPYYWYIDGPVSDTVQSTVNRGRITGILQSKPTAKTGAGEWFELNEDHDGLEPSVSSDAFEVARTEIENVLEEDYEVFSSHEEKIEEIYDDAPYDFQPYFKFDVLFELERFADGFPWALSPEELSSQISTAEAYLPLELEFEEFNTLFSRYVNTAKRYFDFVSDEDRQFADRFKQLSESVWRVYCQQLRILEHDQYYDSHTDAWETKYDREKKLVANDIVEFRRLLDSEMEGGAERSRIPEDNTWGRIVSDYLDEPEALN
jgi:hypothetical protein